MCSTIPVVRVKQKDGKGPGKKEREKKAKKKPKKKRRPGNWDMRSATGATAVCLDTSGEARPVNLSV